MEIKMNIFIFRIGVLYRILWKVETITFFGKQVCNEKTGRKSVLGIIQLKKTTRQRTFMYLYVNGFNVAFPNSISESYDGSKVNLEFKATVLVFNCTYLVSLNWVLEMCVHLLLRFLARVFVTLWITPWKFHEGFWIKGVLVCGS